MSKEPQITRNNMRYEPYSSSRRVHRRPGTPPPENWGNRARCNQHSLDSSLFDFIDDLNDGFEGDKLHQLFRERASQPGPLGQAIRKWLWYDNVSRLLASSEWPSLQTGMHELSNQ